MKNNLKLIGAQLCVLVSIALAVVLGASCAYGAVPHGTFAAYGPQRPCTGRVVHVRYGQTPGCNVRPPQRMVVSFPHRWTDARMIRVCDDMGGALDGDDCHNPDF